MPRFVILRHELPQGSSHWDVMLEGDESLLTWSISEIPTDDHPVIARRLPDHRTIYLDYEGPVSGDRGDVRRWDAGTYQQLRSSDRELEIHVHGNRIQGLFRFEQIDSTDNWNLILESVT